LLREYNRSVDNWQKKDNEMSALLDKERKRKHLSKSKSSLDIHVLTKDDRNRVLRGILKKARRDHVDNIQHMMDRMATEAKKRAKSR